MPFSHEKELRDYCRELKRNFNRINRAIERTKVDSPTEKKRFKEMDRVSKDMARLEHIVDFPDFR